jgi:hypothetical protein
MAGEELVTRQVLRRELLLNAATKPLTLGVTVAVAAAAFFIAYWLLALAALLYIAFGAATFFDGDEAERVGRAAYARRRIGAGRRALPQGLAPEIESLVRRARLEEARIAQAIEQSNLPLTEVSIEVDRLTAEMENIAGRAQVILNYLSEQRPEDVRRRLRAIRAEPAGEQEPGRARDRAAAALAEQLRAGEALKGEFDRFVAEMEHLIASLAVVHAQLVRMTVVKDAHLQEDIAGQVRDLRERVSTVAAGMSESVTQIGDTEGRK